MAGKKRVSFTLDEGDYVNEDLRELFMELAEIRNVPVGQLLTRAFYLVRKEFHHGEEGLNKILAEIKETPCDPNKPLIDAVVADVDTWREHVAKYQYENGLATFWEYR